MGHAAENVVKFPGSISKSARETLLQNGANELVFAVVGHVGSGTTEIASKLISLLKDPSAIGQTYDVSYIKATDLISEWAVKAPALPHPTCYLPEAVASAGMLPLVPIEPRVVC